MTAPEPRTWAIPLEPEDVERVRDRDGQVWERVGRFWTLIDGACDYTWGQLLAKRGPLTEVVETEVEAAARTFTSYSFTS